MKRISVKIFVILMVGFMLILGISAKLNIDAQKNIYCRFISERYNYTKICDDINNLFNKYGVESDKNYAREDILKITENQNFEKELQELCPGYWNYIFITSQDDGKYHNKIESYTFGADYLNNYITVYSENDDKKTDLSIEHLPYNMQNELLELLKKGLYTNTYNDYSSIEIKYQVDDSQLIYFECRDIVFGKKTSQYQKGIISNFCIQDQSQMSDPLRQVPILVDTNIVKEIVKSNSSYSGDYGSYLSYFNEVGEQTYFLTNMAVTDSDDRISVNIVSVVDGISAYVIERYIEENSVLYISASIMAVIISIIFSYMIAKPIRKVEKAALKIASQDFDKPLFIKSKDEIGSLAKSIDSMRIQLKETIENLQQEIEKVKNLESLRKDFINQFTHEMKTPLGIINGYSELIEETKNEEEVNKYLNIINRETNRVNELIQSMLKLSRLEAKKVELSKQDIDLEESVVSIVDEYEVLLMKKNIKVEVNVVQATIDADKKLIETVIHNFLSNAIKHTDENHKIIIDIENGVSIFNEGKLIDDDKLDNVWYTFVTHDRDGSGLGLAICRSILDLHEFKYGVENKDKGVSFYFNDKV